MKQIYKTSVFVTKTGPGIAAFVSKDGAEVKYLKNETYEATIIDGRDYFHTGYSRPLIAIPIEGMICIKSVHALRSYPEISLKFGNKPVAFA